LRSHQIKKGGREKQKDEFVLRLHREKFGPRNKEKKKRGKEEAKRARYGYHRDPANSGKVGKYKDGIGSKNIKRIGEKGR